MKTIVVDETMKEMTPHGTAAFPLIIYDDHFADFQDGYINWHWHKEIQFSLVLGSEIQFFVEGQSMILKPGEAILINKNVLHQIKPVRPGTGTMFSLDFDETFIGGDALALVNQKYINPLIHNPFLKCFCFRSEIDWQRQIIRDLLEVSAVYQKKEFGYELRVKGLLCLIWQQLVQGAQEQLLNGPGEKTLDEERVKIALQFIQEHYRNKITLADIAASIHLSKSECCRCFQRVLKLSPLEFVLQTRIYEAAKLLGRRDQSVSQVALEVGFKDISYFGKLFKQRMGCSPSDYTRHDHQ